ncbi:MAG TPA: DNA polymerase Y family protein [Terriglobales bacterium]|nr:DNA polymerase Y family protein [Terriglobales bacterium]
MPFACIFVPDFPVEAIVRLQPELREQAVAVLAGNPPLEKICALNEKARQAGIEPGMTKVEAELCPALAIRTRSASAETAAHAALLDCAQSFSPVVEDTASDTVVLDLAGLESLFGPPGKIARDLARRASELGLEVNVGVASNPDAAQCAAHGFPGITVIEEGREAERLGPLPLEVLIPVAGSRETLATLFEDDDEPDFAEKGSDILETLDRWGIRSLRALAALPDIAVCERLGQFGLYLQRLARGRTSRTLVPVDLPLAFEETLELEHPISLLEPLAFALNRLLEQLCARLAARALATNELRLRLELDTSVRDDGTDSRLSTTQPIAPPKHGDTEGSTEYRVPSTRKNTSVIPSEPEPSLRGERESRDLAFQSNSSVPPCLRGASDSQHGTHYLQLFERNLHLPVPMLDARIFLKLLQLDLRLHPPGAPITRIWLGMEPVRPRVAQNGLFLPVSPEPERLELTLARVTQVVGGEEKVGSPQLLDTHAPGAFRMQHFTPPPPDGSRHDTSHNELVAALRIFRPPLQVSAVLHAGNPVRVMCAKKRELSGEIIWSAGPWRSCGDWWKQDSWARDEWDIAVQNENSVVLYRMYRDLTSGRWYLEGTYD